MGLYLQTFAASLFENIFNSVKERILYASPSRICMIAKRLKKEIILKK